MILPSSTALCASAYSNHNALNRPGYLSKDNSFATDSTRVTRRRCIELYRLGLPSSKNARHLCRDDTSRTTSQCSVTKPSRTYRDNAARYLGAAWLKTIRTPATSRGTHPSPGPSDTIPTLFAALDADVEVPSSRRSFGNSTRSLLSSPFAAVFFDDAVVAGMDKAAVINSGTVMGSAVGLQALGAVLGKLRSERERDLCGLSFTMAGSGRVHTAPSG